MKNKDLKFVDALQNLGRSFRYEAPAKDLLTLMFHIRCYAYISWKSLNPDKPGEWVSYLESPAVKIVSDIIEASSGTWLFNKIDRRRVLNVSK